MMSVSFTGSETEKIKSVVSAGRARIVGRAPALKRRVKRVEICIFIRWKVED